jgi:hypothetical protein
MEIQWFVYNAGPTAKEAIFANFIRILEEFQANGRQLLSLACRSLTIC